MATTFKGYKQSKMSDIQEERPIEEVLGSPLSPESLRYYSTQEFFKDKNVVITGATGGVGSILVKTLCDLGANVMAISHHKSGFDKFKEYKEKSKNQPKLSLFQLDLSNSTSINNDYPEILKKLKGKLDILLLCHGHFEYGEIFETSIKDYDDAMTINLRSFVHLLSLSTPFLKISKGCVVMCSSIESYIPAKGTLLNSLTKSMINSLIENSALELASFGVRVNGVAPGPIYTSHRVNKDLAESNNQKMLQDIGMTYNILNHQVVYPQDVVDGILFLASSDAGFMTGEIIKIDNGYSLNHDLNFNEGFQ